MAYTLPAFPGVAQYPVGEREAVGDPMCTVETLGSVCFAGGERDMTNLEGVFELAGQNDATHNGAVPDHASVGRKR